MEAIRVEYDSKAHRTRSMDNRRCRRRLPLMIVWPTTVIIDSEGGSGDGGPAAIKHVYAYFITTTEIEPSRTPSCPLLAFTAHTVLKISNPRNKYTFIFGERFSILNVYVFSSVLLSVHRGDIDV